MKKSHRAPKITPAMTVIASAPPPGIPAKFELISDMAIAPMTSIVVSPCANNASRNLTKPGTSLLPVPNNAASASEKRNLFFLAERENN